MVEEVFLPMESGFPCGIAFPIADSAGEDFLSGQGHQSMEMIGHEDQEAEPPTSGVVVESRAIQ